MLAAYVTSGCLQTMTVDWLRLHRALGHRYLLLPTLANVIGMACCGFFPAQVEWRATMRLVRHSPKVRVRISRAAAVDLASGALLTGGLLLTGGGVFAVLYNSVPAWTALLSRLVLGQQLAARKLLGVVTVCAGLALNVLGTQQHSASDSETLMGAGAVLTGSFLHSTLFLLSELAVRRSSGGGSSREGKGDAQGELDGALPAQMWSCLLGSIESIAMMLWVCVAAYLWGFDDPVSQPSTEPPAIAAYAALSSPATPTTVFLGVAGLITIDAIHSASFFALLSHLGAVSAALLKGIQTITIFLLSAVAFCDVEPTQCITRGKLWSIAAVLLGTLLYSAPTASVPTAGRNTTQSAPSTPAVPTLVVGDASGRCTSTSERSRALFMRHAKKNADSTQCDALTNDLGEPHVSGRVLTHAV